MPDLDEKFAIARAEMRAVLRRPAIGAVTERARRRIARRRAQAIVMAVAAVAVALPVIQSQLGRMDTPTAGAVPGTVVAADFADRNHGYVLLNTCLPGPNTGRQCDWHMAVTTDGVSWRAATTPDFDGTAGADVVALGGGRAVIEQEGQRWFTGDGAQTWRRVPGRDTGAVNTIPDGAVLQSACTDPGLELGGCPSAQQVFAVLPDSGRLAPLANQPALASPIAQAVPAAGGGWWVYGDDPATGRPALAVSTDSGRSWRVSVPPELPGEVYRISVVVGPDALYAAAEGLSRQGSDTELGVFLGLYRSIDGGRHWEVTWRAVTGKQPLPTIGGMPVVTATGDIFVPNPRRETTVQVSRDGGRTFTPGNAEPRLEWVSWTRSGYLNRQAGPPVRYSLSQDGVSWRDLALP